MPLSTLKAFFDSRAFEDWKSSREAEFKTQAAIVNRLNTVINGLGVVAKTVARSR
ncbi:hypothetical protein HZU77_015015 [Neisseriaceae bacterium TC5R-5]|nr:hypothetical protein [Neisseriaceae bacterium TC5R-5]